MPAIVLKDYTWRQTKEAVIISVDVNNHPNNADIFAIDNYVKINFTPFIFELFLSHDILEESSECILSEKQVVLTLKKGIINRKWDSLVLDDLSKEKKSRIRAQAVQRLQMLAEQKRKKLRDKKQELQRQGVREQIDIDTETLKKIEMIRDSHRKEAMSEFENWRKNILIENIYQCPGTIQNKKQEIFDKTNSSNENSIVITEICEKEDDDLKKLEEDKKRGEKIIQNLINGKLFGERKKIFETNNKNNPKTRQFGTISIKFSERIFPTPARESHHLEEQEWLEKQAEAKRTVGFTTDDLRSEEQDPLCLKDKGDEFFKIGNYLAAISAYTHGIKLSDKMSQLYANRSAAQYAIGNFQRCAEDCSTALELMVPKCEGNRESRARCHARLGAALCKLSASQHGIGEFEEALQLSPNNLTIKNDLNRAKRILNV
ncbi:hypothetical protein HCN44_007913 [Aphidius gifuensis]|uniref:CS domain-containing protein n=1 Tax=Aphidius gifuensis TaxID=684658 RepID=A0A835CUJ5_APHGI|nr:dynein axonemal assembly factor 4-like [Aphidius gifuensis]KAF7993410.1 hypothetical protein HCN44_007913 [Aphidius gifuensis]